MSRPGEGGRFSDTASPPNEYRNLFTVSAHRAPPAAKFAVRFLVRLE